MRSLRRAFGDGWFVAVGALTIALGVGANLVVFTIINAIWLRPPPVHDPERVVVFRRDDRPGLVSAEVGRWDAATVARFKTTGAFEAVAGQVVTRGPQAALLTRLSFGPAADVTVVGVTEDYFRLLALPIMGRDFARDDDRVGAMPVAIISDRLWRRAFGARSDVIGATVATSAEVVRVIGVASPGFRGAIRGEAVDVWVPPQALLRLSGSAGPPNASLPMTVFCRLNPGLSPFDARVALASLGRGIENNVQVIPLSRLFGSADLPVVVIEPERIVTLAAVAALLVLTAACATLMALALVHYQRRRRELAICLALGAPRRTLVRQLAVELIPVAIIGGLGALMAAQAAIGVLPTFSLPGGVDLGRLDLGFDWRVGGVALAACLASIIAAVAVPVSRFTAPAAAGNLVTVGATASRSSLRGANAVLVAHAAATVEVLVAAALLVQAAHYGSNSSGFDVNRTLFMTAHFSRPAGSPAIPDDSEGERLWSTTRVLMEELAVIPGIEAVAIGPPPLGPEAERFIDVTRDIDTDLGGFHLPVSYRPVGSGYLSAIGAPVLLGEDEPGQGVLITASLAGALWPDESPVGRPLAVNDFFYRGTVAGVVDISFGSIRRQRPHVVFDMILERHMPAHLLSTRRVQLVINASEPDRLRGQLLTHVQRSLPGVHQITIKSGRDVLDEDLGREQLGAWLFSGFGLVGLLLGAGAVIGLVAHQVTSRRAEFGVMLALGSGYIRVIRKALLIGLRPTLAGALIGLVLAALSAGALEAFLLGARSVDVWTYIAVLVLFSLCAALAAVSAAWPLRRLSPRDALTRIAD